MKFKIDKDDIINQLNNLQRVTSKTQTDINIRAEENNIILTSTNGNIILKYKIKALDVSGEPVSVKAKDFYSTVDRLEGVFEFDDGVIKNGKRKLQLAVNKNINSEAASIDFKTGKVINLSNFKEVIKKRLFACAKEEIKGVITNLCISNEEICATDSNVLSIGWLEQPIGEFLITQEIANEIIRCFEGEKLEIIDEGNKLIFKSDNVKLIGFKINAQYPKYRQLLPHNYKNKVELNKKELLKDLEVLEILVDEYSKIKLLFENDKLTLSCLNQNKSGDIEQNIKYSKDKFEVFFNIKYLINILKNCSENEITMSFEKDALRPVVFETTKDYFLLMPMRCW